MNEHLMIMLLQLKDDQHVALGLTSNTHGDYELSGRVSMTYNSEGIDAYVGSIPLYEINGNSIIFNPEIHRCGIL